MKPYYVRGQSLVETSFDDWEHHLEHSDAALTCWTKGHSGTDIYSASNLLKSCTGDPSDEVLTAAPCSAPRWYIPCLSFFKKERLRNYS